MATVRTSRVKVMADAERMMRSTHQPRFLIGEISIRFPLVPARRLLQACSPAEFKEPSGRDGHGSCVTHHRLGSVG
jgi:hypothetical protein